MPKTQISPITSRDEGKFYSIFSFLFGFGFALQIARAEERGDLKGSLFKRRLFLTKYCCSFLILTEDPGGQKR